MRVVSLVPSWTETLVLSGVNVVGRTRYCVHPDESVKTIPIIGGTKNWDWPKIERLQPSLIILDREENPKFMAEQTTIPWHATHVESVFDMPAALSGLAQVCANSRLEEVSLRWSALLRQGERLAINDLSQLPAVIEWGKKPDSSVQHVLYMIWNKPWMCVSRNTFIGSVCGLLGVELPDFAEKYPKINLADYRPEDTLVLLSSEPYPFLKRKAEQKDFAYPHAYVDGESFSWFGSRSLTFLERCLP